MADNKIKTQIEFTAKDGVSPKVKAMDKTFNALKTSFIAIGSMLTIGVVAKGFQAVIKNAMDAERVNKLLDNRLKSIGASSKQASIYLQRLSGDLQDLTGFDDESLKTSMTDLITITGDYQASIEGVRVSADLARTMDMDLVTATQLVGRAYLGNVEMLQRYGIQLEKGTKGMGALKAISEKTGGSSVAFMETMAGAVARLTNNWNDLLEAIGTKIDIKQITNFWAGWLKGMEQAINGDTKRRENLAILTEELGRQQKILDDMELKNKDKPLSVVGLDTQRKLVGDLRDKITEINAELNNTAPIINTIAKSTEEGEKKFKGLEGEALVAFNNMSMFATTFGEGLMGVFAGTENAWVNLMNSMLGVFIDFLQEQMRLWAMAEFAKGNYVGSALALAGIGLLEGAQAGLSSSMSGNTTAESSPSNESSYSGGFATSTSSQATAPSVNNGSQTLNIFINNPSFMSKADFEKTIDMLFSTAQNNGWNVELNNSYSIA